MHKMKVAIVIEKYNPLRGGAERSSMEMAEALSKKGCDVTIVSGKVDNAEETAGNIKVVDLEVVARRNVWFRVFDRAVSNYFSKNKYDIVHSITPISVVDVYQPRGGSQLNAIQQKIALCKGLTRLYKRLTAGFNRARAMRLRGELKLSKGTAGPVVAVLSDYVARQFIEGYGTPIERIALIRNAVDVNKFELDSDCDKVVKLRNELDINDNTAVMLFVSADPVRKGLPELIEAFALAKKKRIDIQAEIKLIVIGGFNFKHYAHHASSLGIGDDIIFYGKTMEVPLFMEVADALVLPTWEDACSRVVMEALAAGIPAISTDFNGASELFDDGKYGINIGSPSNIEVLADAINTMADKQTQQKYADNIAASDLKERLSMDRHASELIELYNRIIKDR